VTSTGTDRYGFPAGPTAAAALVQWVGQAIDIGQALNDDMLKIGHDPNNKVTTYTAGHRGWVDYVDDADLVDDPEEFFKTFVVYRQHREDMILKWFCDNARTFRLSRGEAAKGEAHKVDDRPIVPGPIKPGDTRKLVLPDWYSSPDPLAALPDAERDELLDFLRTLVGSVDLDKTPRFRHRASTYDLSFLLDQMCSYDDMIARTERDKPMGDYSPSEVRQNAAAALERINGMLKKHGWDVSTQPFDALVRERRRQTGKAREDLAHRLKAEGREITDEEKEEIETRTVETRQSFYLNLLAKVYGDEVKDDKAIQVLARCKDDAPLAGYDELFRIDPKTRTIQHTPEFARRFAKELGSHSECVARRIARQLWELRKLLKADKRAAAGRILRRSDELVEQVAVWSAFRVPCPVTLEAELHTRMGAGSRGNVRFARPTEQPVVVPAGARLLSGDKLYEVVTGGRYVADVAAERDLEHAREKEIRGTWERERSDWLRAHPEAKPTEYPKVYLPSRSSAPVSDLIPVRALGLGTDTSLPAGFTGLRWEAPPAGLDADNVIVADGGLTGGKGPGDDDRLSRAWDTHGQRLLGRMVDLGAEEEAEGGTYSEDEAQRAQMSREFSVLSGKYKVNASTLGLLPNPIDLLFSVLT
jgi:hypothetical protein